MCVNQQGFGCKLCDGEMEKCRNMWQCRLHSQIVVIYSDITGLLICPQPDQEGDELERQKILSFIYPIYNHNWRNIREGGDFLGLCDE